MVRIEQVNHKLNDPDQSPDFYRPTRLRRQPRHLLLSNLPVVFLCKRPSLKSESRATPNDRRCASREDIIIMKKASLLLVFTAPVFITAAAIAQGPAPLIHLALLLALGLKCGHSRPLIK